jgi:3-oxoacyl-[acyl-carrier protein] reductase
VSDAWVVRVGCDADALIPVLLTDTDEDEWERRCEAVVLDALHRAQEGLASFEGRGGRIIFVMPSVSLIGAEGLAPLTAALEGVRALAKSAARQWADRGVTVNCVAGDLTLQAEIAGVVSLLSSEEARTLTGQTIVVDGGHVMLP